MAGFTTADVPDQTGKTIFVTGANTGLGFAAAKILAGKGARVLLGCRSLSKAQAAKDDIQKAFPSADLAIIELDLGSLASIQKAAQQINQESRLDVLINNAGIMVPPLEYTQDGFESQFGVNHLGPFALTSLLLDKICATPNARIVSTASLAHRRGEIYFDDINAKESYSAFKRYAQSKIANLYFGYELQRRLTAKGDKTISLVVHPGVADTELSRYIPKPFMLFMPVLALWFNSAEQGAWPTLCAATMEGVKGGEYYGPSKRSGIAGPAIKVKSTRRSHNKEIARKLWDLSVEMTGIKPNL
ncbi:MAG: NAD(P)-dependent dehydrogenase (short-subunit alcohol dehydrogenase family) [Alphaproteobacteria bacterium]|jgi:NAD(P)-dependent dehydrogenase (short-subunit alcohol dehydrogenase family)